MRLGKSTFRGTLIAGLMVLGGSAFAQTNSSLSGSTSMRGDYEQRAVRRSAGQGELGASSGPYRTVWAPTRSTAYQTPSPALVEPSPAPVHRETIQGAMEMEPIPADAYPMGQVAGVHGGCQDCGEGGGCDGGACCPRGGDTWCGCEDGYVRPLGPLCFPWLRGFSLFFGVHGFKNVADQGDNGNFGVHEGVNWGGPLGGFLLGDGVREIGWQVGLDATQSNFSGSEAAEPGADRNQIFLTGGLFKRATCGGLQWGVVYDYLRDKYYLNADLRQLRAEVSLVNPCWGEFGFWGAFAMAGKEDYSDGTQVDSVEAMDMYTLFLRRYFTAGGEGRLWGGGTRNGDGLVGADMQIPLGPSFALVNSFNYLIPKQGSQSGGQEQESWAVNLQLVWYPGRSAMCAQRDPFRPLLPVADNTYFMLDHRVRN